MFISQSDRSAIVKKAKDMVEISWTPKKDLNGWNYTGYFRADKPQKGIPYSQTFYQKDDIGFKSALANNSDFYDTYKIGSNLMPKYGNDCSGFVSFAWGLQRKTTYDFVNGIKNGTYDKVGSYDANSPKTTELEKAYKKLKAGDAVVYRNNGYGHTFIIASNDKNSYRVYVYEQTDYCASYKSHSYRDMASYKYLPFAKK